MPRMARVAIPHGFRQITRHGNRPRHARYEPGIPPALDDHSLDPRLQRKGAAALPAARRSVTSSLNSRLTMRPAVEDICSPCRGLSTIVVSHPSGSRHHRLFVLPLRQAESPSSQRGTPSAVRWRRAPRRSPC